ncbi:MAG: TonB-dependent receptor plug domain-containing protein [Pseudohongiellaceae bacterium]
MQDKPSAVKRCFFAVKFCLGFAIFGHEEVYLAQEDSAGEEIEEIVITSTRSLRSFAVQPTRVEVLGAEELNEKANMKPGSIRMLLNESTGIYVQQTSPTSFNSSIRIQGLDGKYTQLLRDGMPLYGGFAGGLSLLQIAPLDLQQVEVIKGASSTLFGGGAIAGLVNLVSKTPGSKPESALLLNGTSAGGMDASGFFSRKYEQLGATLFTSYNRNEAYDPADNGFSAIPEFERFTFNPRLFFEGENSQLSAGLNAVTENRLGGDLRYIDGSRTQPRYFENNNTSRLSSQVEYQYQLANGGEFVFRNSVNYFDRQLEIPSFNFSGVQLSSFSEAHLVKETREGEWIAGVNMWTEDFDQSIQVETLELDFSRYTVGGFVQATHSLGDRLILESGLRLDQSSEYGNFLLPRLSLLFTPTAETSVRIGGGMGYKEPTPFTEAAEARQFRGVLPLDENNLDAERSVGVNVDINRSFQLSETLSFNLNWLLFYTRVDDPLSLVESMPSQFEYAQIDDYLDTTGTELNAVWRWNHMKFFLGYTFADVSVHRGRTETQAPLIPEERVNAVLVYEREDDLRVGLEAYYFSSQKLTNGRRGRDYWIFGLMMEKIFNPSVSLFLNFENFTDTRQTRFDPIFSGSLANPVFTDIFAPLDGFVVNGGVKIKF